MEGETFRGATGLDRRVEEGVNPAAFNPSVKTFAKSALAEANLGTSPWCLFLLTCVLVNKRIRTINYYKNLKKSFGKISPIKLFILKH